MKNHLYENVHKNLQKELLEINSHTCSLQSMLQSTSVEKGALKIQNIFEIYQNLQTDVARLEKKLLVFEEIFVQDNEPA